MAEHISAEAGALANGQQAVAEARQGIQQEITRVRGEIEQMGSYWSGDAATAFTRMVNAWDEKTSSINNQLNQLEQSLRSTEQEQERYEQETQQSTSKIASMLS